MSPDELFRDYGDVTVRLDNGRTTTRVLSECQECGALVDSSWDARNRHQAWHEQGDG